MNSSYNLQYFAMINEDRVNYKYIMHIHYLKPPMFQAQISNDVNMERCPFSIERIRPIASLVEGILYGFQSSMSQKRDNVLGRYILLLVLLYL